MIVFLVLLPSIFRSKAAAFWNVFTVHVASEYPIIFIKPLSLWQCFPPLLSAIYAWLVLFCLRCSFVVTCSEYVCEYVMSNTLVTLYWNIALQRKFENTYNCLLCIIRLFSGCDRHAEESIGNLIFWLWDGHSKTRQPSCMISPFLLSVWAYYISCPSFPTVMPLVWLSFCFIYWSFSLQI